MPRKRENKNYRFVPFLPDVLQKIAKKIAKKLKKIKKIPLWLHLRPKQVGKGRERKKINLFVQFRSYPTRNRKFQEKSKKIKKKLKKYHYGSISNQNRLKEDEKGRK